MHTYGDHSILDESISAFLGIIKSKAGHSLSEAKEEHARAKAFHYEMHTHHEPEAHIASRDAHMHYLENVAQKEGTMETMAALE